MAACHPRSPARCRRSSPKTSPGGDNAPSCPTRERSSVRANGGSCQTAFRRGRSGRRVAATNSGTAAAGRYINRPAAGHEQARETDRPPPSNAGRARSRRGCGAGRRPGRTPTAPRSASGRSTESQRTVPSSTRKNCVSNPSPKATTCPPGWSRSHARITPSKAIARRRRRSRAARSASDSRNRSRRRCARPPGRASGCRHAAPPRPVVERQSIVWATGDSSPTEIFSLIVKLPWGRRTKIAGAGTGRSAARRAGRASRTPRTPRPAIAARGPRFRSGTCRRP